MVIEIAHHQIVRLAFGWIGLSQVVTNGPSLPLPPDGCLRVIFSLRPFALQMQIDKFPFGSVGIKRHFENSTVRSFPIPEIWILNVVVHPNRSKGNFRK